MNTTATTTANLGKNQMIVLDAIAQHGKCLLGTYSATLRVLESLETKGLVTRSIHSPSGWTATEAGLDILRNRFPQWAALGKYRKAAG